MCQTSEKKSQTCGKSDKVVKKLTDLSKKKTKSNKLV